MLSKKLLEILIFQYKYFGSYNSQCSLIGAIISQLCLEIPSEYFDMNIKMKQLI